MRLGRAVQAPPYEIIDFNCQTLRVQHFRVECSPFSIFLTREKMYVCSSDILTYINQNKFHLFMKPHFLSSVAFVVILTYMAMSDSFLYRVVSIIPLLLLFYATLFLFGVEYDKIEQDMWKKKEERLTKTLLIEKKIKQKKAVKQKKNVSKSRNKSNVKLKNRPVKKAKGAQK